MDVPQFLKVQSGLVVVCLMFGVGDDGVDDVVVDVIHITVDIVSTYF